ncbi:hypothetical protein [Muricoccus aerilatus]|uniref:hypothetical protein n=1 Tax=Muricoccus aerilatus TaxID=452982 RepID=UPI000693A029|nr:hypothetical protein [Roseomonas aerilata]
MTDASHAWIQVLDANGRYLTRFGGKGGGEENLVKPEGIAADASGRIFVADYATSFVHIYDPAFRRLSTFCGFGTAAGSLSCRGQNS